MKNNLKIKARTLPLFTIFTVADSVVVKIKSVLALVKIKNKMMQLLSIASMQNTQNKMNNEE